VLILALDTTTRGGSAAVLRDDVVLSLVEGDGARTHGERLPGELDLALARAGEVLGAVDLLAVATGPGPFTGLRIGMATMQGLALVTGKPVVGVSALDALVQTAFEQLAAPRARIGGWTDAARGEVFAALYDVERTDDGPLLTRLAGPDVGTPDEVWSSWSPFLPPSTDTIVMAGEAAVRYRDRLSGATQVVPHPLLAPAVARLARRLAQRGAGTAPHLLQPLYVRRPDVERL
jgi:tRNA threonylcarbamoyladenosine biosynthesis protein TsaB